MKPLLLKSLLAYGALFSITFLGSAQQVKAQSITDYYLGIGSSVYTPLPETADTIAQGDEDGNLDDQTYLVSLPFSFNFNGVDYTEIYVNANGYISFGGDCSLITPILDAVTDGEDGVVAACNADLLGVGTDAFIRTGTIGSGTDRDFIIEWDNMDDWYNYLFFDESASALNFQVILHEGNDDPAAQLIQIVYGEMTVSNTDASDLSITVGLRYGTDVNVVASSSGWTGLSASTDYTAELPLTDTEAPVSGTVLTFSTDVALPVMLSDISATNAGSANIIKWTSSTEAVGDRYILERSIDSRSFSAIYILNAKGEATPYQYEDKSPLPGINFYRLQVINSDNTRFYSKIVTAQALAEVPGVQLMPNPAYDNISMTNIAQYKSGMLRIVNNAGEVVYTSKLNGEDFFLNVALFPPGLYLVQLSASGLSSNVKFVKK